MYPDVTCFGVLRVLGGQQTVEILACTYHGTKTKAEFTKQLREELLEVVNHAHTVKKTQRSVYHRRTSLKPVQRKTEVYIHRGEVTTSQR